MRIGAKPQINNSRGKKFYGAVAAESHQRWAVGPPCRREGYNSFDAHPSNCDYLNPTNAVERGGRRNWQCVIHEASIMTAVCASLSGTYMALSDGQVGAVQRGEESFTF